MSAAGAPSAAPGHEAELLHRRLWVFDFDWTVVDENSDTWIHRCAPGGAGLPPGIKNSYAPPDWVGYMNRVLGFLAQQGVTADDLRAQLKVIPWTPGMRPLLEAIADSTASAAPGSASDSAPAEAAAAAATKAAAAGLLPAQVPLEAAAVAAAALCRPAAGSPLAALEEEDGEGRPPGVSPGRFLGTQHAVILSDANSLFIPWILDGGGGAAAAGAPGFSATLGADAAGRAASARMADSGGVTGGASGAAAPPPPPRPLMGAFLAILTNPAAVDPATGAVHVSPHHGPMTHGSAAPPHCCPRCHPNLCKRAALRRLLDEQVARGVSYRQLVYVGDGRNDLCPILALREGDVAMPRVGFALHKLLGPMASKAATAAAAAAPPAVPEATAATEAAGENGSGGSTGGVAGQLGRGDDHVYGEAPPAPCPGVVAQAPRRQHDVAAVAAVAAGAAPCGDGRKEEGEGERLRAACVPWVDAYDIFRWVRMQDEQDEGGDDCDGGDVPRADGYHDLAARAGTLML